MFYSRMPTFDVPKFSMEFVAHRYIYIYFFSFVQIMSNDEYKSVEHRVLANPHQEARVSVATFFNPGKRGESVFYGPLPELLSPVKPARYKL
ncbi:unnamed protein product [Musa acuminata subsp. malaccensis]|uniref:(wild Malaysian banana) hypothetical protein n=1 Tax=Musa acuminata subsp. malaccensis TaxID=214687 RepID=A0A804KRR6_MUSAM|nr:unnamed protein product [Musa acuminata subsp. malaccensis]